MSDTPAARLARLKVTYPNWRFERRGDLYRATGDGQETGWTTLGDLEQKLSNPRRKR